MSCSVLMWGVWSPVSQGDVPLLTSASSIWSTGTRCFATTELARSFFIGWCLSMLPPIIRTPPTTSSCSRTHLPTSSMYCWDPYPWKQPLYLRYSVLCRQVVCHRYNVLFVEGWRGDIYYVNFRLGNFLNFHEPQEISHLKVLAIKSKIFQN